MIRPNTYITGDLCLSSDLGGSVTARRIELLEAIDNQGSISAAAKQLKISYRSAWDALDEMNNLWDTPLVAKQPGGSHGGGTRLTNEGRQLISGFKVLLIEYNHFTEGLNRNLDDFEKLQQNIRKLTMRTSARNQFQGIVEEISAGPINSEVTLMINGKERLIAMVTSESVEQLGLSLGSEAYALIKASFIILVPADQRFASSARNRLCGTIRELRHGPVNSEALIALNGDKTLTAIITEESAKAMHLEQGRPICALIKASHVILGVH
ncbi:MAG: TOBE domain-containing protein [Candidatus Thiodiazotropha sp. L084R]